MYVNFDLPKQIFVILMVMAVVGYYAAIARTFQEASTIDVSEDTQTRTPSDTTTEKVLEGAPAAEKTDGPTGGETSTLGVGPTPNTESEEMVCLALNIYFESRSDNLAGKLAVADVVLNRVSESRYPDTICGVVKQSVHSQWWKERGKVVPVRNMCAFSWYCDGRDDIPQETSAWEESRTIAGSVLQQEFNGLTEGATHYHALHVQPNWVNDRGMRYLGQIGQHKFYRWH